jgi:hypothetical protein
MTDCHPCCSSNRTCRIAGRIVLGVLLAAVLAAIFGFAVMWLWNHLMPVLFTVRPIGYWQAVGLLILARLLFGGHHGFHHRGWRHRNGGPCCCAEPGPAEPEGQVQDGPGSAGPAVPGA